MQIGRDRQRRQSNNGLRQLCNQRGKLFGSGRDRRLNRWLLSKQLTSLIAQLPQPVVGLTTLPITADLPDALPVDR